MEARWVDGHLPPLLVFLSPTSVVIRALKRRLDESASPEGLIASFRTREVAEPAL